MQRLVAVGLAIVGAALLAAGLFLIWLNTGREGTGISDAFLVPFSATAATLLACSIIAAVRGAEGWLWMGVGALAVLVWGSVLVAAL